MNGLTAFLGIVAFYVLVIGAVAYLNRNATDWREEHRKRRSDARTRLLERAAGITAALVLAVLVGFASPASAQVPDDPAVFTPSEHRAADQERMLAAAALASGQSEEAQWCKNEEFVEPGGCPKHPIVILTLAQLAYIIETDGEFLHDDYPKLFRGAEE